MLIPHRAQIQAVRVLPAQAENTGFFDHLLAFGMWLWCAATFLPVIVSTPEIDNAGIAATDNFRFVPFAAAAMIAIDLVAHERLWVGLRNYLRHSGVRIWLIAGMSVLLAIFAIFLGKGESVFYAGVLLFTALHLAMVWGLPVDVRTTFFRALVALLVFTAVMPLILYGPPVNRWVGGIHPNVYGSFLIGIVIFSTLAFPNWGAVAVPFGLAGAVLVSSRYTMVAIGLFAIAHVAFNPRIARGAKWVLAYTAVGLALTPQLWKLVSMALLIEDTDRGVASGGSGRTELWLSFWPQFVNSPLIGFGFRSRSSYSSVHNAYLGLLLENGLFVGAFVIGAILVQPAIAGFSIMRGSRSAAVLACLCGVPAIAVGAFFQPQIINFGDPMGIAFLFLMLCPVAVPPERVPALRGFSGREKSASARRSAPQPIQVPAASVPMRLRRARAAQLARRSRAS